MDTSQMSNGEYSSDGGGPASPPILPPSFSRFGMPGKKLQIYQIINLK